jgi:regulator of chromosome condensation
MNWKRDDKKKEEVKDDRIDNDPMSIGLLKKRNVIQVTAGDCHAAVLTMEGDVFTWGIYKNKQGMNTGFKSNRPKDEFQDDPEQLVFDEPIVQIASTSNKTIALTHAGEVYEWGETSSTKRVGSRHTKDGLTPTIVNMPEKVCKIFCSSGGEQVFAVTSAGFVYVWGLDKHYQLGIFCKVKEDEREKIRQKREVDRKKRKAEKDLKNPPKEKKVVDPKKKVEKPEKKIPERKTKYVRPADAEGINELKLEIKKITGGHDHSVLLTKDGAVYSWGRNNYGQLGLGLDEKEDVKEPRIIKSFGDDKIVDISCGAYHTLFLSKEGVVYGCGLSKDDRIPGGGKNINKPTKFFDSVDDHKIIGISSGKKHNLLITESKA